MVRIVHTAAKTCSSRGVNPLCAQQLSRNARPMQQRTLQAAQTVGFGPFTTALCVQSPHRSNRKLCLFCSQQPGEHSRPFQHKNVAGTADWCVRPFLPFCHNGTLWHSMPVQSPPRANVLACTRGKRYVCTFHALKAAQATLNCANDLDATARPRSNEHASMFGRLSQEHEINVRGLPLTRPHDRCNFFL